MGRFMKQLVYGGAFLLIAGVVVWSLYRAVVPAPTCTDGIMNGREEGVDCGAVCGKACAVPVQPLVTHPVQLIANADGSWDALVQVENPNGAYGVSRAEYAVDVYDASGATLATRRGATYVHPAQSQYLVLPLGALTASPASASVQVPPSGVQWAGLAVDAAGAVQFTVRNESLVPSTAGFRYEATVVNRSDFDFDQVDVVVLLDDARGAVVGAGSTVVKTLRSNEIRAFVVDWPFAVPGVTRAQVFVGTNLFDNTNFLRTYGAPNQFPGQ